jgi:glycosyltransferase involved in cell wall biosynthesis
MAPADEQPAQPQATTTATIAPSAHAPSLRTLVILPAYNEADSIAAVVTELRQRLPEADVLVVDDGSRDATAARVPRGPGITVVSLPFNLGIGGAMQTGYRFAEIHGYDMAIQVDADGQHPPHMVRRVLDHLRDSGADMVIGSRFLQEGTFRPGLSRMVGIRVLRALIRSLSGRTITDCTSGFRAVNRRVIKAFAHWYPDDYPEPEVVLLLLVRGFSVSEIGVEMEARKTGQTSIPLIKGLFYVVKVSVCLLLDMARDPWPLRKVDAS